jgi:hypothetical protein
MLDWMIRSIASLLFLFVMYLCVLWLYKVWTIPKVDTSLTSRAVCRSIYQAISNPLNFTRYIQEGGTLALEFKKRTEGLSVRATGPAQITGKNLEGLTQYECVITNGNSFDVNTIDLDFQFPYSVVEAEITDSTGVKDAFVDATVRFNVVVSGGASVSWGRRPRQPRMKIRASSMDAGGVLNFPKKVDTVKSKLLIS